MTVIEVALRAKGRLPREDPAAEIRAEEARLPPPFPDLGRDEPKPRKTAMSPHFVDAGFDMGLPNL